MPDPTQNVCVENDGNRDSLPVASIERLYRNLVDNSLGLICAHDMEGKLLTVNRAAAESLGFTREEMAGRDLREFMPVHLHPKFDRYITRLRRLGTAHGYLELRKRDGATVTWLYRNKLLEEPGCPPVVIGHAQDISWRIRLEQNLRESNENYRRLYEEAPVAYHEIDRRGVVVKVNRAECELLGRSREELLGRPVWEAVLPEFREESRLSVEQKLAGLKPLAPFFRVYQRKDGKALMLKGYENPILSAVGEIIGIRTTLLDMTEQNRIESELRQLNAELDQRVAERTAELNASHGRMKEFVYTVSHDLQEPLRSISSFAKLLQDRYASNLDEDGIEFLEYVMSGSARMSKLIRDLLSYSRVLHDDRHGFEDLPLNRVIEVVCEILSNSIESSGASIEFADLPIVHADSNRMVQLFQNLISNSIKYRSEEPPVIKISASRQGGFWKISVSDNGIGIREADRERVFGLFKRSSAVRSSGTGVGLAICKAIVERHGGKIWIENDQQGTTFALLLPACNSEAIP